jgi:hypothetical protein
VRERKGNLFDTIGEEGIDCIAITTNGHWTVEGTGVMGGGSAGECAKRWPETNVRLGKCLKNYGTNVPFVIGALDVEGKYLEPSLKIIKDKKFKTLIVSFPTIDNLIEGAKLSLIENSAKELKKMADRFELRGIVIGRPGCGIGSLSYEDVKPVLESILDDRFTIFSFPHED